MFRMIFLFIPVFLFSFGLSVLADVSISRKVDVLIFGTNNNSTTVIEQIQGDKCSNLFQIQGGEDSISLLTSDIIIFRIDKGVAFMIDPGYATYDEIPLDIFGEMMTLSRGMQVIEENDPISWTITVERGLKQIKLEYNCTGIRIRADGVNKDDSLEKVVIIYEQWNSNDITIPKEFTLYHKKLKDISGIDFDPHNMVIEDMASQYYPYFDKFADIIGELDGFRVNSHLTISVDCPPLLDSADDKKNHTVYREAFEMMKYLSHQAGRKIENGMVPIFKLNSNIIEINTELLDSTIFEAPEGFTKIVE